MGLENSTAASTIDPLKEHLSGVQTFVYPPRDLLFRKVYSGEWVDGKRHGKGTLEWKNGAIYQGQWKEDTLSGIGSFYLPASGVEYEGEFSENQFHGSGVLTWKDTGRKYNGAWQKGKHHGYGTLYYDPNDSRQRVFYKGEWIDGKREGYGIMRWKSGAEYEGKWALGQRDGTGKQTFSNGDIHVGHWKNALRHGPGCRYFASGDKMFGTWKDDKKHGLFEYIYAHGRCEARLYVNGVLSQEPITQEVTSLQVLCIEALAKKKSLALEAEKVLPTDLAEKLKCKREVESAKPGKLSLFFKNILTV